MGKQNAFYGGGCFRGVPLLDIKPYVKYFDIRDNVVSGWVDKHFQNGTIPDNTIIKS